VPIVLARCNRGEGITGRRDGGVVAARREGHDGSTRRDDRADRSSAAEAEPARLFARCLLLVVEAFEEEGMQGLLDEKRGCRGPLKVTPEINEYVQSAQYLSGAELSVEVTEQLRRGAAPPHVGALAPNMTRFLPATDRAQLDCEQLREMALAGASISGPSASRFQRGGLPALVRRPSSAAPR
jgi:hypothetical protein